MTVISCREYPPSFVSPCKYFSVDLLHGHFLQISKRLIGVNSIELKACKPGSEAISEHALVGTIVACMGEHDAKISERLICGNTVQEGTEVTTAMDRLGVSRGINVRLGYMLKMPAK